MTQVAMHGFNNEPILTTYSGEVVADGSGNVVVDVRDIPTLIGAGFVFSWPNNLNAITDPVATNDATQGYGPGSLWLNTVFPRLWVCQTAANGAAVWFLVFQQISS
jgi:hypothetical protein